MKLTTQHAVIISTLIVVLGALAYFDKGFDTIGLLGILAALGFIATKQGEATATTQSVKEQTNGNMTKLLELVEKQGDLLAKMQPLPTEDDPKI